MNIYFAALIYLIIGCVLSFCEFRYQKSRMRPGDINDIGFVLYLLMLIMIWPFAVDIVVRKK